MFLDRALETDQDMWSAASLSSSKVSVSAVCAAFGASALLELETDSGLPSISGLSGCALSRFQRLHALNLGGILCHMIIRLISILEDHHGRDSAELNQA